MLWVDLSVGAWSPRHAAGELMTQLGLPIDSTGGSSEANAINRGVDNEARGDGARQTAYADARRILAALLPTDRITVLRPRGGLPVRSDNRLLIRYLRALGAAIAVIGAAPGVSAERLPAALALYPGLVPLAVLQSMEVAEDHRALHGLGHNLFRIDAHARTLDPRANAAAIDRLAVLERIDPRLRGYVEMMGSALFVDPVACAAHAQDCVQTSPDLAIALAARARACARAPLEAAVVALHQQGIRIFLHRFGEAAAAPDPSVRLPAALRAELSLMKGWGKVMIGDLAEAQRCFATHVETGEDPNGSDAQYRRNILALANFRAGRLPEALRLEETIAEALAAQADPDPQLQFVNAINLARLHRATNDMARYRHYLSLAFATSDNVRSATEILQLNLLSSDALASTDPAASRAALLRAAFAWLAAEPSDALGVRALRLFLGSERAHPRVLDALVSCALERRLVAVFPNAVPRALESLPQVVLTDDEPAVRPVALAEANGLCLIHADHRVPRLPRSAATHALAARAFAILDADPAPERGCWLIDNAAGLDVAGDPIAVRSAAWRHGLDASRPPTIGIGPAVRRIERGGTRIVFRRHLPPVDLDDAAAALVAAAAQPYVPESGPTPRVADLIERRVLGLRDAA